MVNKKMKVNLGCGNKKLIGFVNVDLFGEPDIKHDLNCSPYPFRSNSVDFILCEHCLEHLKEPELFFREIHRILKIGGIAKIVVPHKDSGLAYSTFGHRGFYQENAIDNVCSNKRLDDASITRGFELVLKKVKRGKFLKFQKREITWVIRKIGGLDNDALL